MTSFNDGIESAAEWHAEQADKFLARMDGARSGHERSFIAQRHSFHRWAEEEIRALAPAAPEPLFAPREYEADDFGPIGDAARRICSYAEGEVRKNVYRAAKRELAALQPAPEPSEAKRMAAIEDRAILEMRRYTANGAPCSQPWGGCDVD